MAQVKASGRPRQFWLTRNGLILAAAMITSAWVWWVIAWPVVTLANRAEHSGHFAWVFGHVIGGTGMLFLGGLNLYLGATRQHLPLHRMLGRGYLILGTLGSLTAITVLLTPAHKAAGEPLLTNITVSLLTLATAWLAFAAMGWRAARNRRFDSHRDWMIRAYILVWSFVLCRIVSRTTALEEGDGVQATIWLAWVGPLIVGEILLQWKQGGSPRRRAVPNPAAQVETA